MRALTHLARPRSIATQLVVPFTGEGAYHGSTKPKPESKSGSSASGTPTPSPRRPAPVEEMRASTLEALAAGTGPPSPFAPFEAHFPNRCETLAQLPVPSQAAIRDDAVTFCWCPIEQAIARAGPLTREVLTTMRAHLEGHKRHVYVDSKIQYFEAGDVPVDSQHWHVDGSITTRGPQVEALGFGVIHDMLARLKGPARPPSYLSYQSSHHCATRFACEPVTLQLPALIPNFDQLDRQVRARAPACAAQPAGAIVRFDGRSLHRAIAARDAGWRLWVRVVETDRQVQLDRAIIECYGTVFRTARS